MRNDVSLILRRKKSQTPFFLGLGIISALLGVASFALFCLYYPWMGGLLFYGLGIPLTILLFWASFALLRRGFIASYLCKFFMVKKKNEVSCSASILSSFPFTADAHFESVKVRLSNGSYAMWASPFGELPFQEGVVYSLRLGDGWILGWEAEK